MKNLRCDGKDVGQISKRSLRVGVWVSGDRDKGRATDMDEYEE